MVEGEDRLPQKGNFSTMKTMKLAVPLVALCADGAAVAQVPDHVTIGLAGVAVPDFQGAKDYRTLPFPLLDIKKGRFFANLNNGIGLNAIDTGSFQIGGGVTFVRGYRGRDVPRGIGRLKNTAGARLFASTNLSGFSATLGATKSTGATKGTTADLRIAYAMPMGARFSITPAVATSWADSKYMRGYFGVNAAQAAASGLPFYRPKSGFKDVTGSVTANYRIGQRWNLTGMVGVSRLVDDAADAPIVERRSQPIGMSGLSYNF